MRLLLLLCLSLTSCGSPNGDTDADTDADAVADADAHADADADADEPADADAPGDADGDADAPVSCADMSAACASEFGSLFTPTNGRADGTLLALLEPTDTQCELSNRTHVVLQLSILGHVQRLVVSVNDVSMLALSLPLWGPDFEEGWHEDMTLDYVTHLGVHSTDFTDATMDEVVAFICSELQVGEPVSVFAYCDGEYPGSAHQIHRVDRYPDGAIVARPTSGSPVYLLFRYADQVF